MSGGSMNYICYQVEEASRCFNNPQIRELVKDVSKLLHDKEWADSGDYCVGEYNKTEKEFCEKWLCNHNETLTAIVSNEIEGVRNTLLACIGLGKYCKDCVRWKKEKGESDYGRCKEDKWLTHGYEFACDDWSDNE